MTTMREKIEAAGSEYEFGGQSGYRWVLAQADDWKIELTIFDDDHRVYNDGIGDSDIDADDDWEKTRTEIVEVLGYLRESSDDTSLVDDLIEQVEALS